MIIRIEIECDNAAFEDDFYGELKKILRSVESKVYGQRERSPECVCDAPEASDKLLDTNGNTVGFVKVER